MQSVRDRFGFTEAVRIMQAEMAAALTNGQWMGWLSSNEAQKAWSKFMEDWHRLTLLEANAQVIHYAAS